MITCIICCVTSGGTKTSSQLHVPSKTIATQPKKTPVDLHFSIKSGNKTVVIYYSR